MTPSRPSALPGLDTALAEVSARVLAGVDPGGLIDLVAGLERVKRAISAVQADATQAFAVQVRASDAERGVARARRGAGVGPQIAAARRSSPHLGGRHVGAADALTSDLPHTLAALRAGVLDELTAYGVVRETFHLDAPARAAVDERLLKEYARPGVSTSAVLGSARALATEIDPRAALARISAEEAQRYVSVRAASHAMAQVTAMVPLALGVTVHKSLLDAVHAHANDHAPDDERTRQQVMADTFVERLTGRAPLRDAPAVVVNLVMTEETLLRQGDQPAALLGYGALPADHARALVHDAAEADQAWVRRVYTRSDGAALLSMDARSRLFPAGLATFLRVRDQRCATPYCNAYVQHIDHVTPHRQGGGTTAENGQGLCARCNYVKEIPGFSSRRDPSTQTTVLRTPTSHEYERTPPPVLGHLTLPAASPPAWVVTRVQILTGAGTAA